MVHVHPFSIANCYSSWLEVTENTSLDDPGPALICMLLRGRSKFMSCPEKCWGFLGWWPRGTSWPETTGKTAKWIYATCWGFPVLHDMTPILEVGYWNVPSPISSGHQYHSCRDSFPRLDLWLWRIHRWMLDWNWGQYVVSYNLENPIAGWFISWKIQVKWMIWGYPIIPISGNLQNSTYKYCWVIDGHNIQHRNSVSHGSFENQ